MVNELKENLYVLKSNYNQYKSLYKQAFKDLKTAKKNSNQDLGESEHAKAMILNYKSEMDDIADNYKNYLAIKSKVQLLLKISNKNLAKTKKLLKKDMLMEKQRHKNYMAYRKSIQYFGKFR